MAKNRLFFFFMIIFKNIFEMIVQAERAISNKASGKKIVKIKEKVVPCPKHDLSAKTIAKSLSFAKIWMEKFHSQIKSVIS